MAKAKSTTLRVEIAPNPVAAEFKPLGGSSYDAWNLQVGSAVANAIPGGGVVGERGEKIASAALQGLVSMRPDDPVEGMLAAQMVAAHNAALELYRRAWIAGQTFEVQSRYLALADKAARTVAVLTEALDRHRNRGQQQITVKHVTVNADQAVIADQVVGNPGGDYRDIRGQPHALAHAPGAPLFGEIEADRAAVLRTSG
jgi:hypothetical protein